MENFEDALKVIVVAQYEEEGIDCIDKILDNEEMSFKAYEKEMERMDEEPSVLGFKTSYASAKLKMLEHLMCYVPINTNEEKVLEILGKIEEITQELRTYIKEK